MNKIFEVIDSSNNEQRYSLGYFDSLELAIEAIKKSPDELNLTWFFYDSFEIKIREYKLNILSLEYKDVYVKTWYKKYSKDFGEYTWELIGETRL